MFLSDLSIKRPVLITCIMLALVIVGLFAMRQIGVDSFPKIDIPVITISAVYPGASPDAIEQDVVKKIEEAVNSIEKVQEVSANIQEGMGTVIVEFEIERNIDQALEDIRSRVGQIRRDLPDDVKELVIKKFDPAQIPILSLIVKSSMPMQNVNSRELTRIASDILKPRIERISGVGKVTLVGGSMRSILVQLDPHKLKALGIGLGQVIGAIKHDTKIIPSGNLLTNTHEISVQIDAKTKLVEEFNNVVIMNKDQRPIRLSELATVIDGENEKRTIAQFDGNDVVALDIQKQIGGNTVSVIESINDDLREYKSELDKVGVTVLKAKDCSKFIKDSVDDVKLSIILGGCLTVIVVFLFLKSWRSTIITSLTLPVSVISTFIIMKIMDFTFNTMTLMALSLAIGILIDDAIVVRENITRHSEMGKDHITAAREGTAEIGPAVIATTLSILAVFIPVAFMGGIAGRFFFSFGIVVAFAVSVSLFVSFTLDPMLSAIWSDKNYNLIQKNSLHSKSLTSCIILFDSYIIMLEKIYKRTIIWSIKNRGIVMALGVSSFILAMGLSQFLGRDFKPDHDRGDFQVGFRTENGTNLLSTQIKARQLEEVIKTNLNGNINPEIDHTYTTIGTGSNGNITEGSIYVKLSNNRRRNVVSIRRELRDRLVNISGVETDVSTVAEFGDSKPIMLAVMSRDKSLLNQAELAIMNAMHNIDGVVDISSSRNRNKTALHLVIDRNRASDLGISPSMVGNVLRPLVNGLEITKYEDTTTGEQYDVIIRLSDLDRSNVDKLQAINLESTNKDYRGNKLQVRLSDVAHFEEKIAASKIERRSLQSQILISANKEGRTIQEIVSDINKKLFELRNNKVIPEEVTVKFIGTAKNSKDTARHMGVAMFLAVAFIYFVLASQFESFKLPIVIMFSLPLSIVGMVLMLLITGDCNSMMTSIGLIMLMGLVTKNAILLVDRALQNVREHNMIMKDALVEAGITRLRPILMTSCAMIGGMLPLFFAIGAGAQMRAPMARAVVGGLITSTLLTLIVIPVFLDIMYEFEVKKILVWILTKIKDS